MKELPILFSGPMVRAILEGRKTQTRRVLKPQPRGHEYCGCGPAREYLGPKIAGKWGAYFPDFVPSRYSPGDRLWVKETFRIFDSSVECACYDDCLCSLNNGKPFYQADCDDLEAKWTPSIFLPRWASRITLLVTNVRVERLQDISEADAIAEGIRRGSRATSSHSSIQTYWDYLCDEPGYRCPRSSYSSLWESINGPGSWDRNPWVWVIEFKRVEGPPANV